MFLCRIICKIRKIRKDWCVITVIVFYFLIYAVGKTTIWLYSHAQHTPIMINILIKTIFQISCLLAQQQQEHSLLHVNHLIQNEPERCTSGGRNRDVVVDQAYWFGSSSAKTLSPSKEWTHFFLLLASFFLLAFLSCSLMTTQYPSSHDQQWEDEIRRKWQAEAWNLLRYRHTGKKGP